MKKTACLIAFICAILTTTLSAQVHVTDLSGLTWTFRMSGTNIWYPAEVPGCVHTDLLGNGLIPDPFFAENEEELQWIDTCDWEYQMIFFADDTLRSHRHIKLVCEGLDTYADVFLNEQLVGASSNMFRKFEYECNDKLLAGENTLRILFHSTLNKAMEDYTVLPHPLPYDERVTVRKAPYQFGWDWGPRFVTMGIWKGIRLETWDQMHMDAGAYRILALTDKKAELEFTAHVQSEQESKAVVKLISGQETLAQTKVKLKSGKNQKIQLYYTLKNPELWWPNGMGEQRLYDFTLRIEAEDGSYDETDLNLGLRTIELQRLPDSLGQAFFFRVNGRPLFIKGANYIPMDVFPSRVDSAQYVRMINQVAESHMNMIRVWGGGIYEKDLFYQQCDRNGILVWQDFMFACHMMPGDTAFINESLTEITEQVTRLRNHPSIALWCGNNEIDEGWKNWGMQKQFGIDSLDSVRIWNDYLLLFHKRIPALLADLDPDRFYHPSSPMHGWGRKESMTEGDAHYWGVWWGDEAFEIFNTRIPRFMSEYGFQGFPDLKTLNTAIPEEERYLFSDCLKSHEKHPRGFELISSAMLRNYFIPKIYENYAILSQIVQADAMQTAIEAHRRNQPYCMGSMYWQLNDCWPVVSWSTIDYLGRSKAAQYTVKHCYETVILSIHSDSNSVFITGISDSSVLVDAQLKIKIMSNEGVLLWSQLKDVKMPAEGSILLHTLNMDEIYLKYDTNTSFLYAELTSEKQVLAKRTFRFCKAGNYKQAIYTPDIQQYMIDSLQLELIIGSKVPVLDFFISSDADVDFSNNFLDLMPWESQRIIVRSRSQHMITPVELKMRCLEDLR